MILMIKNNINNDKVDFDDDNNDDDKLHNIFMPYINQNVNKICFNFFDK
jgi:hypothetical protein